MIQEWRFIPIIYYVKICLNSSFTTLQFEVQKIASRRNSESWSCYDNCRELCYLMTAKSVEKEVHVPQDGWDGLNSSGIGGRLLYEDIYEVNVLEQKLTIQSFELLLELYSESWVSKTLQTLAFALWVTHAKGVIGSQIKGYFKTLQLLLGATEGHEDSIIDPASLWKPWLLNPRAANASVILFAWRLESWNADLQIRWLWPQRAVSHLAAAHLPLPASRFRGLKKPGLMS